MEAQTEVNLMEDALEMGKIDKSWEHINRFEAVSAHPDYDDHRFRWTARMKDLKGRILLTRGHLDGAEQLAQECLEKAARMDMKKYTARAELYQEMKRPDQAREQWQAAAAIVRSTADGLEDDNLRETFLGAAPVQEIMAGASR
jgi:tetratricopeptide (TPR) repeat protein